MGNYTSLVWKSSSEVAPETMTVAYTGQDASGSGVIAPSMVITEASVIESTVNGNADIKPVEDETVVAEVVPTAAAVEEGNKDLIKDSAVLNPSPQQSPKLNGKRKHKKGKHH
jgi:hypothetical protein